MNARAMTVFGLAGWSGSGKTTLMGRLLPELIGRGISVSTIKHAHHNFDMAEPKEGDFRLRRAGLGEMMLAAPARWALLHELDDAPEPMLGDLLARLSPVDLVLIEGFKAHVHPKLEVHRQNLGKPLLAPGDPHIVAIAAEDGNVDLAECNRVLPVLDLRDAVGVADLIVEQCGLGQTRKPAVAAGDAV